MGIQLGVPVRIGFISGDVVEVTNARQGVSVPDYPVQGFLMKKLRERGHDVVLLTRVPNTETGHVPVQYHPGDDPNDHEIDVLFGDRLGPYGSEWTDTLRQLERYEGPIVYHQYVPYSGWAPPFRAMPWLLGHQRQWTIINRAANVKKAYHTMAGFQEAVTDSVGAVRWERWEPFLMLEYPWQGLYIKPDAVHRREFRQGYYGRVPTKERRAASVLRWMSAGNWSRVIYGPTTSCQWISEETGAYNGGRILHRELPDALETFNIIVQCPIDRLQNKGQLHYWPHRIVECALAGVFQLFDPGIGIPEFRRWEVRNEARLHWWMEELTVENLQKGVRLQQEVILPRADPVKVMDRLMEILEEASS